MISLLTDGIDILMEQLGVDIPEFVFWIIIVFIFASALKLLWKNEIAPLVDTIKTVNEKIEKTDRIDLIEKQQEANMIDYKNADRRLDEKINAVSDKIDLLCEKLDNKIAQDNEVKRGELKDRIRQSYGYYHSKGKLTTMEREALEGLIRSYEKSGGSNSFVHTIVEPEMYTWEILD